MYRNKQFCKTAPGRFIYSGKPLGNAKVVYGKLITKLAPVAYKTDPRVSLCSSLVAHQAGAYLSFSGVK